MKSPLAIASLAALGLLLKGASAVEESARVNGWYPCAYSTPMGGDANATSLKDMAKFECSELEVPLCYDGVCESDRKINLFVKRRLGKTESKDPSVPRKAAIVIQGGPGAASVAMESVMDSLVDPNDDTIDFYTFDHRGTGRTEFLQCDAAGALTPGSPGGNTPSADELPNCIADLSFQYDGQAAAFSTTSAAMDVRMIIDTFLANHDVFPYGMSYGTYLTQRILQLKVPQIKGYIFDGVDVLTHKDDPIEGANSHWDAAMKYPARRLLEYCFDDAECPLKLQSREKALEEVLAMMDKLDAEPTKCAALLTKMRGVKKPSDLVRPSLFPNVQASCKRPEALESLATMMDCSKEELDALKAGSEGGAGEDAAQPSTAIDVLDNSPLLFDVIVFSERWAQPAPLRADRYKFTQETIITAGDVERNALAYCIYTGSTEPACEELKDELPAKGNATWFYKRDKYFDEPMTLPEHASALVLNGGLDFQTPKEFGELLFSKIKDSGKGAMMVNFDYGNHCAGEGVSEGDATPCHDSIIRQFIMNGGDVSKIDTNCMTELPQAPFHKVAGDAAEQEAPAGEAEQEGPTGEEGAEGVEVAEGPETDETSA